MSSLKGQLSNVEGSVKSMKVAVVVGSVLTVACLAAVFGVTVLANEVSKEVKVSNGILTSKSGQAVLTTSTEITNKLDLGATTYFTDTASFKVNAIVINGDTKTVICDDLAVVKKDGEMEVVVAKDSILASIVGADVANKGLTGLLDLDEEAEDTAWWSLCRLTHNYFVCKAGMFARQQIRAFGDFLNEKIGDAPRL